MSLLLKLFQKLMGLMAFLGLMLIMSLDPDFPGDPLTTAEMLTAYGVFSAMVVIPLVFNWLLGWGWMRVNVHTAPPAQPPTKVTPSQGLTYMHWWSSRN